MCDFPRIRIQTEFYELIIGFIQTAYWLQPVTVSEISSSVVHHNKLLISFLMIADAKDLLKNILSLVTTDLRYKNKQNRLWLNRGSRYNMSFYKLIRSWSRYLQGETTCNPMQILLPQNCILS